MTWSISIYSGPSPLELSPAPGCGEPVLRADDVSDVRARFVADPFMVPVAGRWYMFFEVLEDASGLGTIALAESADGYRWHYVGVVLREDFHLSYPFVFAWRGNHYMIPETLGAEEVRIYRAESFPWRWSCVGSLLAGRHGDPTLYRGLGRWWLFTCPSPYSHDALALFHAPAPLGPWTPHQGSPVVEQDAMRARPAGRPLNLGGRIVRFAQQCIPSYGTAVHALEVVCLTEDSYRERPLGESPILGPGPTLWSRGGMHHVDAHRLGPKSWLACVDGRRE